MRIAFKHSILLTSLKTLIKDILQEFLHKLSQSPNPEMTSEISIVSREKMQHGLLNENCKQDKGIREKLSKFDFRMMLANKVSMVVH